ncbi:MAG: hypothetical protein M3446_11875 [Actinomycetota bacterium]|nr:hypothetical protein [Actinomycetota bacterium]
MTSQNQSRGTAGRAAWTDNSVIRLLSRPLRDQLARNTAPLDARLAALEKRIEELAAESAWTANELRRIAPQTAALESRLADLAAATEPPLSADDAELEASRQLLDEVRDEHRKVRLRLSGVTHFEDRLRKLETLISKTTHPSRF